MVVHLAGLCLSPLEPLARRTTQATHMEACSTSIGYPGHLQCCPGGNTHSRRRSWLALPPTGRITHPAQPSVYTQSKLMAFYRPDTAQRQAALVPTTAALLFIDVQNYNCHRQGAIFQGLSEEAQQVGGCEIGSVPVGCLAVRPPGHTSLALSPALQSEGTRHFFERVEQCQPLWASLQRACRCVGEATSPSHHTQLDPCFCRCFCRSA